MRNEEECDAMFTGLVEEVGVVESVTGDGKACRMVIRAERVLEGVRIGDSIAVNGVCLTVTSHSDRHFSVDVMPETLNKTSLRQAKRGQIVNLERAMRLGDRFGGHIVSGHVDGTGTILSRHPHANAVLFRIGAEPDLLKYVVPRGSICLDGISLTVVDVDAESFSVSIIPHTLVHTNLRDKQIRDPVNLEADVIGKYVERLLAWRSEQPQQERRTGLTPEFLREHGFL